ncbi:MAG: rhodanese-like domain-containing protein [Actinomycetota bacterium]
MDGIDGIDITPADAARRMEAENLALFDVREPYEWEAGHVPGSTHVEMEALGERLDEIPEDRPVAFLCLGGGRSGLVASTLKARGYDAYNVEGGFRAWFEAGLPTEPDDATVAPH